MNIQIPRKLVYFNCGIVAFLLFGNAYMLTLGDYDTYDIDSQRCVLTPFAGIFISSYCLILLMELIIFLANCIDRCDIGMISRRFYAVITVAIYFTGLIFLLVKAVQGCFDIYHRNLNIYMLLAILFALFHGFIFTLCVVMRFVSIIKNRHRYDQL